MLKRGLAAGAVAFRLFCHNDEKVSFSNDPPRRGGGGPTYLKQNLFHSRMIRPAGSPPLTTDPVTRCGTQSFPFVSYQLSS